MTTNGLAVTKSNDPVVYAQQVHNGVQRFLSEPRTVDELKEANAKVSGLLKTIPKLIEDNEESMRQANLLTYDSLLIERKLGKLLEKNINIKWIHDVSTLCELGISKAQSRRWQHIARLSADEFERMCQWYINANEQLTKRSIILAGKKLKYQEDDALRSEPGTYEFKDCITVTGDARELDPAQFPHKYGVIVVDPPWDYDVTIKQGTIDGQYRSLNDEDLKQMPIQEIAADNCVLFLWGTWPKLPQALELMQAWGFDYKTGLPWIKTTSNGNIDYGVGYWIRGVSEYFLIGKRGKVDIEDLRMAGFAGLLWENKEHSRKPESIHQLAEKLSGPYLELFARRPMPGWTVFGNDGGLAQMVLTGVSDD